MDIDNFREKDRQVTNDYAIGNIVYVDMTGIYRKLYYNKQVPYIITEVSINGTVRVQQVQVKERINIRWLRPHFGE